MIKEFKVKLFVCTLEIKRCFNLIKWKLPKFSLTQVPPLRQRFGRQASAVCSQTRPLNPGLHKQKNPPFGASWHVPPFLHGVLEQDSFRGVSHLSPWNWDVHVQRNVIPSWWHVPPDKHGFGKHGSCWYWQTGPENPRGHWHENWRATKGEVNTSEGESTVDKLSFISRKLLQTPLFWHGEISHGLKPITRSLSCRLSRIRETRSLNKVSISWDETYELSGAFEAKVSSTCSSTLTIL